VDLVTGLGHQEDAQDRQKEKIIKGQGHLKTNADQDQGHLKITVDPDHLKIEGDHIHLKIEDDRHHHHQKDEDLEVQVEDVIMTVGHLVLEDDRGHVEELDQCLEIDLDQGKEMIDLVVVVLDDII